MIPPSVQIPQAAMEGVWLRCPSVSGGKDWLGFQTSRGVVTFWGKIGKVNQTSFSEKKNLQAVISSKLKKGYNQMDTWHHVAGWKSIADQNAQPLASKPNPEEEELTKLVGSSVGKFVSTSDAPEWF